MCSETNACHDLYQGISRRELVHALRTVTIDPGGHLITATPQLSADAEQILA